MATDQPTTNQGQPTGRWPKGMNTAKDVHELDADELRSALDVDLTKTGKPLKRTGFDGLFTGHAHSGFSDETWPFSMYVSDGQMYRLDEVAGQIVRTAVMSVNMGLQFSYTILNDKLVFTNNQIIRTISLDGVLGELGIDEPAGQPLLSAASGGAYDAGKYQVAITFVSATGEESGSTLASVIELAAGQSIMLDSIPQPATPSARVRIYASGLNGDALYQVREIPAGVTTYLLDREFYPTRMLDTQFCSRIPAAEIIRYFKGRLYFVIGPYLFYTEALRYGLYKINHNYIKFQSDIVMLEVVDDGMYVGTEKRCIYLTGSDPKKFEQRVVDLHGAVPRASLQMRGSHFGQEDYSGPVVVWWTVTGNMLLGLPGGRTKSLTEQRLSLPKYKAGALMFRELNGMKHLLSVLSGAEGAGFGATDNAVAEVVRNGIAID